jgi:hypothetical protein
MISLALLSGCTAVSHPSALGTAAPDSAAAVAIPVTSSAPVPLSASPPAPELPSTATASTVGTPTSAAVASPTTSPTALSSNDIAAGVRATAQAFFTDLNIAFATGDLTSYNALTSAGCGCRSIAKTIQDTYNKHQHIVGVALKITSLQVVSFIATGATADVYFSISAGQVFDASGAQVNTALATPAAHSALFIMRVGRGWIVQQNTLLDAPKS